ncbi:MAG: AAA family ATPase [Hydrogenophilales bacterium]|nr:AAA family ATPase [Hydrogenophilales bacterium]
MVIVDATFIRRDWREPFARLARERALPRFIAAAEAALDILRERVGRRMAEGRDASEAGLEVLEAHSPASNPSAQANSPMS